MKIINSFPQMPATARRRTVDQRTTAPVEPGATSAGSSAEIQLAAEQAVIEAAVNLWRATQDVEGFADDDPRLDELTDALYAAVDRLVQEEETVP